MLLCHCAIVLVHADVRDVHASANSNNATKLLICSYASMQQLACYAMLCYAMLCYAMLCYAMLCYAMLCYVMLCYAMLCYAMLCYDS